MVCKYCNVSIKNNLNLIISLKPLTIWIESLSEASVYAQRSVASSVVELKREIGLLSAVSLIVSVMIGKY